jgi:hypothetical protein
MELKDVILSTLAEIEEIASLKESETAKAIIEPMDVTPIREVHTSFEPINKDNNTSHEDEMRILDGIRERLLVLFEGFQSPNNVQIEAKVDLTLNFLEYLLATIDNRLETIKEK